MNTIAELRDFLSIKFKDYLLSKEYLQKWIIDRNILNLKLPNIDDLNV